MPTAVLGFTVGLFAFGGLPVSPLSLPVILAICGNTTFITAIRLAPPATPAYAEMVAAPTTTNAEQQQKIGLQPCKQSEAVVKEQLLVSFRPVCGALFRKPEVDAFGLSLS